MAPYGYGKAEEVVVTEVWGSERLLEGGGSDADEGKGGT